MREGTRRRYDTAFKIETVKLIESENYSLGEASIRLGISKSSLGQWKRLYGHNNKNITSNGSKSGLTLFERQQLEKELLRVRKERDILKKALAYFAVDPVK